MLVHAWGSLGLLAFLVTFHSLPGISPALTCDHSIMLGIQSPLGVAATLFYKFLLRPFLGPVLQASQMSPFPTQPPHFPTLCHGPHLLCFKMPPLFYLHVPECHTFF